MSLLRAAAADDAQWTTGTYTTGYWDCCKPSCSWSGKGSVTRPVRSCEAETGNTLDDPDTASVCDGGTAASCADHQPFDVEEGVTMGFAAAAVGGASGLKGDENCGECYELRWTAEEFSYGGGAHPDIVGKKHIIQVTNIGHDVSGSHSFDLQIPGSGQGIFTTGCAMQFPGYEIDDFDCGNNYGGCEDVSGCADLPGELRAGCEWRYSSSYSWKTRNGKSDNPYVRFRRVKCPQELVALSGTEPLDNDEYPDYGETEAPTSSPKPTYSPAPTTLRPTMEPTQSGCCFYPEQTSVDVCAACESFAPSDNWCAQSQSNCEHCSATWCGGVADSCAACQSFASLDNWCAQSQSHCEQCSATWCG
ncbi:hypothetical protein CTAYLR_009548 [Chrysophaeum taylorii]|uniref:cellulase n=1 Tax=Chrysophaeum taylorii TaxID=2483200 RepID=A0AAD7UHX9_9STRA|nr:hypothetical protein CTAYLR_009548 [Chrysophaeum taylorii]